MSSLFLSAEWRNLIIVSWNIDEETLIPYLPKGTELDLWQGKALISLVGFQFLKTKIYGFAIPFHTNFPEVNLRFYVTRKFENETRRGVVFIKEFVSRHAIAKVARLFYNENYFRVPIAHETKNLSAEESRIEYAWSIGDETSKLSAVIQNTAQYLQTGSIEEFITEHYWGYTRQRDGSTLEYKVEHERWNLFPINASEISCCIHNHYGKEFETVLNTQFCNCLVAQGSSVKVYKGEHIR